MGGIMLIFQGLGVVGGVWFVLFVGHGIFLKKGLRVRSGTVSFTHLYSPRNQGDPDLMGFKMWKRVSFGTKPLRSQARCLWNENRPQKQTRTSEFSPVSLHFWGIFQNSKVFSFFSSPGSLPKRLTFLQQGLQQIASSTLLRARRWGGDFEKAVGFSLFAPKITTEFINVV